MDKAVIIGLVLVFLGILIIFSSSIFGSLSNKVDIKSAGGFFIGPIPIFGFASDRKMLYLMFAIGVLLFIASYFISKNF